MKKFLGAASVLALTFGTAYADNNAAWLQQRGGDNTALIEQGGDNNRAGRSTDGRINDFQAVTQNGDENDLFIEQSGNGNRAGTTATGFGGQITQTGARNVIALEQSGNGNEVISIQQFAGARTVLEPTNTGTNDLLIIQSSDGNLIGAARQQQNNVANAGPNVMTIEQAGIGNNTVGFARQERGHSNTMDLLQTGRNNLLSNASQRGVANDMTASFAGTDNGGGLLTGFAAASGALSSRLAQEGMRNFIDLVVDGGTGGANHFGITQIGDDNRVEPLTLFTQRVELGITQTGNGNEVATSFVDGADHSIGVRQAGNDNLAGFIVGGTQNAFLIDQVGNGNAGGVEVNGMGNNFGTPTSLVTVSNLDAAWERGVLRQIGNDNLAGMLQLGDGNFFGTLQRGDNNLLTGEQEGNRNQVAGLQSGEGNLATSAQVGNANTAAFAQFGMGNRATISQ